MANRLDKLNLTGHTDILVLNAPLSFERDLSLLKGVRISRDMLTARKITFALMFVTRKAQLDRLTKAVASKIQDHPVLWFASPRGTSRNLTCDLNRDGSWDALREAGFERIRDVDLDADWSVFRFRKLAFEVNHSDPQSSIADRR